MYATIHVGLHVRRPLFDVFKQKLIMSVKFSKWATHRYEISQKSLQYFSGRIMYTDSMWRS